MSCLGPSRGKGMLTVRGVLSHRNHGPVAAEYELNATNGPDALTGTMRTAPAALQAAFKGGFATLRLATGETIPIIVSEVAGNTGQFVRSPIKGG